MACLWQISLIAICLSRVLCHPTLLITSADSSEGVVVTQAALADELARSVSLIAGVENMHSDNAQMLLERGAVLRQLDSSQAVNESVFVGVDSVFVLPPLTDDRVERTSRIVDAASSAGVPRAMLLSVMGADSGLQSLAGYKTCEDRVQRAWPKSHALLRTAFYVQNLLLWAPTIAHDHELKLPLAGGARTAPLFESDVAAIAMAIAHRPSGIALNGIFNVTGSDVLTGAELAGRMSQEIGRDVAYTTASKDEIVQMLRSSAPSLSDSERSLLADLSSIQVDVASHVMEMLAHRKPTNVDVFFSQEKESFNPTLPLIF